MYMYYYHIIILSFFLQYPKYDFANTLYAISPQMYVVTCNCATYLSSLFCIIRCRNQIRVNTKLFVAAQLILMRSLAAAISRLKGQAQLRCI